MTVPAGAERLDVAIGNTVRPRCRPRPLRAARAARSSASRPTATRRSRCRSPTRRPGSTPSRSTATTSRRAHRRTTTATCSSRRPRSLAVPAVIALTGGGRPCSRTCETAAAADRLASCSARCACSHRRRRARHRVGARRSLTGSQHRSPPDGGPRWATGPRGPPVGPVTGGASQQGRAGDHPAVGAHPHPHQGAAHRHEGGEGDPQPDDGVDLPGVLPPSSSQSPAAFTARMTGR